MLDHLIDSPVQYVLALHEAAALAIADGYCRAARKPAFVNVFMAPGTGNLMGVLNAAYRDGTPLVVTASQQPSFNVGRGFMGECTDQAQMLKPLTKWAWEIPVATESRKRSPGPLKSRHTTYGACILVHTCRFSVGQFPARSPQLRYNTGLAKGRCR